MQSFLLAVFIKLIRGDHFILCSFFKIIATSIITSQKIPRIFQNALNSEHNPAAITFTFLYATHNRIEKYL